MPLLRNAKKALRNSQKKAVFNREVKSRVKTTLDKVKAEPSIPNLSQAFSALDKAKKRGIFHRNKVSRLKSQLSLLLNK